MSEKNAHEAFKIENAKEIELALKELEVAYNKLFFAIKNNVPSEDRKRLLVDSVNSMCSNSDIFYEYVNSKLGKHTADLIFGRE